MNWMAERIHLSANPHCLPPSVDFTLKIGIIISGHSEHDFFVWINLIFFFFNIIIKKTVSDEVVSQKYKGPLSQNQNIFIGSNKVYISISQLKGIWIALRPMRSDQMFNVTSVKELDNFNRKYSKPVVFTNVLFERSAK